MLINRNVVVYKKLLAIWKTGVLVKYHSRIEVIQIAQFLAKADAVVTFVSVSLLTQIGWVKKSESYMLNKAELFWNYSIL